MSAPPAEPVVRAHELCRQFARGKESPVKALDGISIEVHGHALTALVGPDGAGKTTLLRIAAGLLLPDCGQMRVLGLDVATQPQRIQDRISYMPQRFGLYEDLTVGENLDLYADLHGVTPEQRAERYPRLMEMTALGPFRDRLAGRLSGGMKQKLGLACTLVRSPELLLLDEPTVGVDPLSRKELWAIVRTLVDEQGLTVLLSTSYLDEAEYCGQVIVLHLGKVLAQGEPAAISAVARNRVLLGSPPADRSARSWQAQLLDEPGVVDAVPDGGRVRIVLSEQSDSAHDLLHGPALTNISTTPAAPRFEDGFMILLRRTAEHERGAKISLQSPLDTHAGDVAVHVRDLVRRFGAFTAVNRVSFEVRRGELFGLLGPNGAGKTTTFRMLCGLLPASGGELRVAGADVRHSRAEARARLGYVAQKFSLYGPLSVVENLEFFASAYGLRGAQKQARVHWAMSQFELEAHAREPSIQLPGGFKQRLAMAAALLHEPEILFLDEPTSGADPLARRAFWRRITALAEQGVTVIVTTHFMQEAEYCDRIAIMDAGEILAQGAPGEIRRAAATAEQPEPTMEDAFIRVVERARANAPGAPASGEAA
ncbi:MAG TPA: ATP-binding cassette domain-containing protein [Steroidobacteraceae bacterium]|nr:ATP-binding cassette domain-containing protein [Steroidobacteraceae bacterium]